LNRELPLIENSADLGIVLKVRFVTPSAVWQINKGKLTEKNSLVDQFWFVHDLSYQSVILAILTINLLIQGCLLPLLSWLRCELLVLEI